MFKVWTYGNEFEWARECWGHLQRAGLLDESTLLQYTASKLRLLTLSRVYEEFCGLAFEVSSDPYITCQAEELCLDKVSLGILAAQYAPQAQLDEDFTDYEQSLEELALIEVTTHQRQEIHRCLCNAYGSSAQLYKRMYYTRTIDYEDDEEDDEDYGRDEHLEVTGLNVRAFCFVEHGFNHG